MRSAVSNTDKYHLLYVLHFEKGYFYVGVSNNLKRRLAEHKSKKVYNLLNVHILLENISEEIAYKIEKTLVNKELLQHPYCLNQTTGGRYPDNKRKGRPHTKETINKIKLKKKKLAEQGLLWCQQEESKQILRNKIIGDKNPAKRPEVRKILREQKLGSLNPCYGKPAHNKGKKITTEQTQARSYKIQTPEGIFISSVAAAKHFNLSQQCIINRCKNVKFKDWNILEKGEKYSKY